MKVILSGAQCSGKSTLMQELKKHELFEDHIFIEEIVRTLMKQGVKINKGADHKSQMIIFEEHHKNLLRHKNFLSDRGVLDAFVYATWDYLHGNYSYEEHKQHEWIFLSCIYHYDYIFFLPVEFSIQKDGVRDTDVAYQKEINDLFYTIVEHYSIPNFVEITGTVEERVKKFEKFFNV